MTLKITTTEKRPFGKILEDGEPITFTMNGKITEKVIHNDFGKSICFTPHDPDTIDLVTEKLDKVSELMSEEYDIIPWIKPEATSIFFKVRRNIKNDVGLKPNATDLINTNSVTVVFEVGHYLRKDDKKQGFYLNLNSVTAKADNTKKKSK